MQIVNTNNCLFLIKKKVCDLKSFLGTIESGKSTDQHPEREELHQSRNQLIVKIEFDIDINFECKDIIAQKNIIPFAFGQINIAGLKS